MRWLWWWRWRLGWEGGGGLVCSRRRLGVVWLSEVWGGCVDWVWVVWVGPAGRWRGGWGVPAFSGRSCVTFLRALGLPDSHQSRQLGWEEHISCQSWSILLGRALVACVVGGGTGDSCSMCAIASMEFSVSTMASLCFRVLALSSRYLATRLLRPCTSFRRLRMISARYSGVFERSSSLTALSSFSMSGCGGSGSG